MVKKTHEIGPESIPSTTEQADFQSISGTAPDDVQAIQPQDRPTAGTGQAASGIVENSASAASADTTKSAIPDLDAFLATLTADQIAKIRKKVERDSSIVSKQTQSRSAMNPDGSMDVVVHIDAAMTEQLAIWAESDNVDVMEEARIRISESLSNYLYGDWNVPVKAEPAPAAAK